MVELGFPNFRTTITPVPPNSKSGIYMDISYVRTKIGLLKCAEILFNVLGFICILTSRWKYFSRAKWFETVSMGGLWFTGIMLVLFIFHVTDKLSVIPWLKIEFCFCTLWTLFYLIAASLTAVTGADEAFAVAAFFGFVATILYGYEAFLKFVELRGLRGIITAGGANSP